MTAPDVGPTRAVELAYPLEYEGEIYEPDVVVELPVNHGNGPFASPNAADLVRTGRARWHTPQESAPGDPPPRSGAGSGRDAWVAYAETVHVPVTDDMSRDDIAAAVEAAGTTGERQ